MTEWICVKKYLIVKIPFFSSYLRPPGTWVELACKASRQGRPPLLGTATDTTLVQQTTQTDNSDRQLRQTTTDNTDGHSHYLFMKMLTRPRINFILRFITFYFFLSFKMNLHFHWEVKILQIKVTNDAGLAR